MRSFLWNQISSCFMIKNNLVRKASLLLSMTKTFVSSTYRISFVPWMFNGRSLIYIKNKRGLRIESCGTPCEIVIGEIWNLYWVCLFLSIWNVSTNWVLFVKYDWNHFFTEALIPYESNLSINLSWLITSHALERSRKMSTALKC